MDPGSRSEQNPETLDAAPVESEQAVGGVPEGSIMASELSSLTSEESPIDSVEHAAEESEVFPEEPDAPSSLVGEPHSSLSREPHSLAPESGLGRPSFLFFGIVSALSLIADITTKVWAEVVINQRGFEPIKIIGDSLSITLAYNQGGAWGMFSTADEMLRKPFFLGVSAFAVFFIISLYSRLQPSQKALKWGLPLVLGGALGNLNDRITRSQVIDFIDYQADWVMAVNGYVRKYVSGWTVTDHWPTFNVADIAICIGVILMAVDMFTYHSRLMHEPPHKEPPPEDPPQGGAQGTEPFGLAGAETVPDLSAASDLSAVPGGAAVPGGVVAPNDSELHSDVVLPHATTTV